MAKRKHIPQKRGGFRLFLYISVGFLLFVFLRLLYFESFSYHPSVVGRLLGQETASIRLKWVHNPQFAGIYSALHNNFYRDRDLNVKLLERDFSKDPISEEVASGKVDFGITNFYDLVNAVEKGKPIIAIASIYQHTPTVLISLKEANIMKPEDLAGKKIGVTSNESGAHFLYDYIFNRYNIPPESVTFVEVGPNQTEALIEGRIDVLGGYRTNETYILISKGIASRMMLPENQGMDVYDDIIITSTDTVKNNPEKVRKFIQATIDGWEWTFQNNEEALQILSEYTKSPYDDMWRNRYIMTTSQPLIQGENRIIGKMSKERVEDILEKLEHYTGISKNIDPSKFFTNEFLE